MSNNMQAQREERTLEVAMDNIIQRVADLKCSLQQLLHKMEHEGEAAQWPEYLEQYSVISAQLITLDKLLRNEKTPLLRNYLTLPLQLNAETDHTLVRLTEGRVPSFGHDFVPDLLRTKVEPDLEKKYQLLHGKMNTMNSDTSLKQINHHNKVSKHVADIVSTSQAEHENETRPAAPQTSSHNDTQSLLSAVGTGKALKPVPLTSPGVSPLPPPQANKRQQHAAVSKAPSSIKTNIKAAHGGHPYQR